MNPDPELARAARDHLIAMLTFLPGRLGVRWPPEGTNWPDGPAWRAAENLAVTLRVGEREFTFVHSLEPERSAMLVVESRCEMVPAASKTECYRKLLAMNYRNVTKSGGVCALDASTKTVIHSSAYRLDALDVDNLVAAMAETAQQMMPWWEDFSLTSDSRPPLNEYALVPHI
ncbi:Tir chaperone protein (CesT) [Variovorax sp. PBL-H6]|uniref:CesT family type III secretion system chaperone n=1 Tax=Variovorax sp. PBL-H6 TaxID=434009 RepID=UPI0013199CFC|nr:CesT family type III secretion system chaperone [Variovorax sp. PBL-H6]VTU22697.1 Tir chaperone protein (CesT) [Variovorax sp. PBL-H6]